MAKGRLKHEWGMTSSILACVINTSIGKSGSPISPDELNPMVERKTKSNRVSLDEFKALMGAK